MRQKPRSVNELATIAPVAIIECVPNISEGRRAEVVAGIVAAARRGPGARLLDYSSDASHNPSVITMAGGAGPRKAAGGALFQAGVGGIGLPPPPGRKPAPGAPAVRPPRA